MHETNPRLLEDVFRAYYAARKNKRNTLNQLNFELNLESNLIRLYEELRDKTYRTGKAITFIVTKPVKREIFAADFRDRVVHHLLFNYLAPIFERTFIYDSYSCRKGKGTLFGIERLQHHIRSCSRNYTAPCYILKMDIQGYFMSINREILFRIVTDKLKSYASRKSPDGKRWEEVFDYDLVMYLLEEIVFFDAVEKCVVKGSPLDWNDLPPSKSLFHSPKGCGLPIGNLTSQLFSNIYLNDFDHYVKRTLKMPYYGRYVDDFYIVHEDKEELKAAIGKIDEYLVRNLDLRIHPKKIYLQSYQKGVEFLGAVVKPYRTYVKNRTKANFYASLSYWDKQARQKEPLSPEKLQLMRASVNSFLGHISHYKSRKIRMKAVERAVNLRRYGYFTGDCRKFVLKKEYTLSKTYLNEEKKNENAWLLFGPLKPSKA